MLTNKYDCCHIGFGLFLIYLAFCLAPLPAEGARKQKVMVLHSYHQGLGWTDSITSGVQSVFDSLDKDFEVYYEYLDTKRHAGAVYDQRLVDLFVAKMETDEFDAVIVSDNNALAFIKKTYQYLGGQPPVVFCGINNYHSDLTDTLPLVTGVTEETDISANFDLMMQLHPERKRIVVILDQTPTGQAVAKLLTKAIEPYRQSVQIETLRKFTLEGVSDFMSGLGPEDMVLLLTFNRDRDNKFISYAEGVNLLGEASSVPIYGPWEFYLGKGIVGGVVVSGERQGKIAAQQTLRILRGESPRDIPIITNAANRLMFDYEQLERFNIDRSRIPESAIIINRPPGFLQTHLKTLFGFMMATILAVGFGWSRWEAQKRKQERLEEINATLDKLVTEKTARLQASNKSLRRIAITDNLTGMYNRGYLLKRLEKEIEAAESEGRDLSIVLLDVDEFKWINDNYGHNVGDRVLKRIGEAFSESLRAKDLAGRYGGEEFLLILPDTNLSQSPLIADRVRKSVASYRWNQGGLHVTVSGGVAQYNGGSIEDLLKRADELLYQAKALGRNRIEHRLTKATPAPPDSQQAASA